MANFDFNRQVRPGPMQAATLNLPAQQRISPAVLAWIRAHPRENEDDDT
jgi:hypothetical protein